MTSLQQFHGRVISCCRWSTSCWRPPPSPCPSSTWPGQPASCPSTPFGKPLKFSRHNRNILKYIEIQQIKQTTFSCRDLPRALQNTWWLPRPQPCICGILYLRGFVYLCICTFSPLLCLSLFPVSSQLEWVPGQMTHCILSVKKRVSLIHSFVDN